MQTHELEISLNTEHIYRAEIWQWIEAHTSEILCQYQQSYKQFLMIYYAMYDEPLEGMDRKLSLLPICPTILMPTFPKPPGMQITPYRRVEVIESHIKDCIPIACHTYFENGDYILDFSFAQTIREQASDLRQSYPEYFTNLAPNLVKEVDKSFGLLALFGTRGEIERQVGLRY